jgi:hypothetical protein
MGINDAELVSAAIVAWTGHGVSTHPSRDEGRVIAALGEERALTVLRVVLELKREFYESDARHTVADLAEMGDVAAEQFRRVHPEISDEALSALAWCYTFDYK